MILKPERQNAVYVTVKQKNGRSRTTTVYNATLDTVFAAVVTALSQKKQSRP
jgi:hypothetical protein